MRYIARLGETKLPLTSKGDGRILLGNKEIQCEQSPGAPGISVNLQESRLLWAFVEREDSGFRTVYVNNYRVLVQIERQTAQEASQILRAHRAGRGAATQRVVAPMPGLVRSVLVQPGDLVAPGTVLLILEAMKMENEVRATTNGVVVTVVARPWENVEKGRVLVVLELQD